MICHKRLPYIDIGWPYRNNNSHEIGVHVAVWQCKSFRLFSCNRINAYISMSYTPYCCNCNYICLDVHVAIRLWNSLGCTHVMETICIYTHIRSYIFCIAALQLQMRGYVWVIYTKFYYRVDVEGVGWLLHIIHYLTMLSCNIQHISLNIN